MEEHSQGRARRLQIAQAPLKPGGGYDICWISSAPAAPYNHDCTICALEEYRVTPDSSHSMRNTAFRLWAEVDRLYLWSAAAGLLAAAILIEIARAMR